MSTGIRILGPITIISSASMTGTSVNTSSVIDTKGLSDISVQFVWTGTPNGTFNVQGSIDGGTTWTNITTNPSSITAGGAAGNALINLYPWAFPSLRCIYTNSSSTGTLNAYFFGREV